MDGRLKYITVVLIALAITAGVYFIPSSITGAAIFTETLSINDTAIAPNDVINPNIIVEPLKVVEPIEPEIIESEPIDDFESQAIVDDVVEASAAVPCTPSMACAATCGDVVYIRGDGAYLNADVVCAGAGTVLELHDDTLYPITSKGLTRKYFDCQGNTLQSNTYGKILVVNGESNIDVRNCDIRYNINSDQALLNNVPIYINNSINITINTTNTTANQASKVAGSTNIHFDEFVFNAHSNTNPFPFRPIKVYQSDYFSLTNYEIRHFPAAASVTESDWSTIMNGISNNANTTNFAFLFNDSQRANVSNVTDRSINLYDSSNADIDKSWFKSFVRLDGTSANNLFRNSKLGRLEDPNPGTNNEIQYDDSNAKYHLQNTNLNVNGQIDDTIVAVGESGNTKYVAVSNNALYTALRQPATLTYYGLGAYAAFLKDGALDTYTEQSRNVNEFEIKVSGFSNWTANESPVLSGQSIFTSDPTTDNTFQNVSVSATVNDTEGDQTRLYSSWYWNTGSGFNFYYDKLMPFDDYHSNSNYSESIVSSTTTQIPWGPDVSWVHNGGSDNSSALRFNGSSGGLNMTTSISGSHTACVFFQNITGASSQEFYYISDGSNEIRMFHWPGGGSLRFFFPGQTINVANPSNNNYVHLCYTYDDSDNEYSIYVDGELNASGTANSFATPSNVYLGMKPTSNMYNGDSYLDDFILVDHAVSAEQIRLWSQKNYTTLHHSETGVDDIVRGFLRASDDYSYSFRQFTAFKTITGNVTGCFDTDSPGTYTLQNNFNGLQSGKPYCIGVLHNNSEIDCNGHSLSHNMKDAINDNSNYSVINHCELQGYLVGVRSLGTGGVINDTQINVTGRSIEGTDLNLEVYDSVLNGTIKSTSGFNVTIIDSEINGVSLVDGVYDLGDTFNASNLFLNGVKVAMYNGSTLSGGLINIDIVSSVAVLPGYTPFKNSSLNHSINISSGGFEAVTMYWDPADVTTENESNFELKQFSGGVYSSIPNTLNTGSNYINVSDVYGQITLMEFTNSPPSAVSNMALTYDYTDLTCSWDAATDLDSDPLTYTVTLRKNGVVQYSGVQAGLQYVSARTYGYGDVWNCSVVANDGTVDGPGNSVEMTMTNTPPSLGSIQNTVNVYVGTNISSNVTYLDTEGHSGTINTTWRVNGNITESSVVGIANNTVIRSWLTPGNFSNGDTINLSYNVSDGYNVTLYSYGWSVINNAPGSVSNMALTYDYTDLTCSWDAATDLDSDPLTYTVTLRKNGVVQYSGVQAGLQYVSARTYGYGDVWNCSVVANDGTVDGPGNSVEMTMTNTPPSLGSIQNTVNVYVGTNISSNVTYLDTEGHSGTVNTTWRVNGSITESSVVGIANNTIMRSWLTPGNFSNGDTINLSYNVSDGYNVTLYSYGWSVINNAPSSVSNLNVAHNYTHVTCSWDAATDVDGDVLQYNVTLYKNGIEQYNTLQLATNNEVAQTYQYLAEYNCSVFATDGFTTSATLSDTVIMNNTPPAAEDFEATVNVFNDTIIDVNFTYEDAEEHTGELTKSWYVNNILSTSNVQSGVTNATVVNSQFGPSQFSKGDTVNFTLLVNDSYNTTFYNNQWTVQNTLPVIGAPGITYNGSALNCSVAHAVDIDNDALTYEFLWYKNGVLNSTVTHALNYTALNVQFNPSDVYHCSVSARDDVAYGASSINATYSFTNLAPVWNVNIWIAPNSVQDAFFNATYTDANGQNGSVNVSWYVNGGLVESEIVAVDNGDYVNRSLTPGNFSRGDLINVTYNVTDGTDHTFAYNTGIVRNAGPTSSPSIVATHSSNSTYENLTFIPGSIVDPEGDAPNISHIGWERNGDPYYIIYAPLDTNHSTVFDKSGNDNHGTSNAVWDVNGTNGWFETAFFDDITINTGISQQTDYSFCFDMRLDGNGAVFAINSSTNSHRLSMEPHGTFGVDFFLGGTRIIKNDQPLPLGQWDHHCVLINSSHLSYYYNGVLNMSKAYAVLSSHNPNHIIFRSNGAIDNVVMVNGTISEDQIKSFANGDYGTIVAAETNVGDVWSGLVTATDFSDPGFPVNANNVTISGDISQCAEITQPGGYTMVRDLNGTQFDYGFGDETCIHITASDVTFDCAGYNFTVDDGAVGDTAIAAIEPFGVSMTNVTIENCNINDYYRSIDMYGVEDGTIENVVKYGGEIILADNHNTVVTRLTSVNDTESGVHLNNSNATIQHSVFENNLCIDTLYAAVNTSNVTCTGNLGVLSQQTNLRVQNTTLNTSTLVNQTQVNATRIEIIDVTSNNTRSTLTCENCTPFIMYPGQYILSSSHYTSVSGYIVNISGDYTNVTFNYSDVAGFVGDESSLRVVDQYTGLVLSSTLDVVNNLVTFTDTNSSFALVTYSDAGPALSSLTITNVTGGDFIGNLTQANSSILYTDADGDSGTVNVTWAVNDDAGFPGYVDVYNESFMVNNNTVIKSNLTNTFFDKDDLLRVTWVASSNGQVAQQYIEKVINNTPPGPLDVSLSYSSGMLNCSVNQTANDTDGDAIQYNYTLYKGAVYNTTYLGGEYYNTTVQTGHTWNCSVFATDGDAGPSTFETLLVGLDTEPFFVNPFLRNDSYGMEIRTRNNVTASGIYNDNQSHVGNGTFRWYVQVDSMGPWVSVYNESFSGITNGTNVTSTLGFGNFTELDVVKVNWSATANGLDSRDYVIFRTVLNTPPELLNVTLNGSSPVDNMTVFINAMDVDNENISNNTIWYKNGVQQPYDQFIMISSGNLTHGDVWNVTVWVNDSQSNSTNITLNVNITDKPLVVDRVNLSAACNVNATANFSHTDYESQNATGFMYWYVNGGYVKNTSVNGSVGTVFNSSLYHGNFTHGDVVNITVNVTDGINNVSQSNTTTLSCPPPSPSRGGGGGGSSGSKAPKVTVVPTPTPVREVVSPAPSESTVSTVTPSVSYSSESHSGGRSPTQFRVGPGQSLVVETQLPPTINKVDTRNQEKLLKFNNRPLIAVKKNILPANVYYPLRSGIDGAVVVDSYPEMVYPFDPVPVLPTGDGAEGEISYTVGEDYGVTLLYEAGFFEEEEAVATIVDDVTGDTIEVIDLVVSDDLPFKTGIHVIDEETVELYAYHPGGVPAYIELNAVLELPETYCRFNVCELFSSEERYVEQYGPFTEGLFVQQFKVSEFIDVDTLTMQWRAEDGNIINSDSITGNVVGYGIIHIISVLLVSALLIAYLMVRDVMRD